MKNATKLVLGIGVFIVAILTGKAQTFNATGSLQYVKVPACSDSVTITAYGAGGGGDAAGGAGGLGAEIIGEFKVNPNDSLVILVGMQGQIYSHNSYSGGGGSFVWNGSTVNDTLMIAAGGGGGGGVNSATCIGGNGSVTETPTSGWGTYTAAGGSGGSGGAGGTTASEYAAGGGGAGWYANGADGQSGISSPYYSGVGTGGIRPLAGGAGGLAGAGFGTHGGYGGGGGAGIAGGGGGGYNGGGGGAAFPISPDYSGSGGGGGSYNGGSNQLNTAGVQTGDGMVVITFNLAPVGPIAGLKNICQGSSFNYSCRSFPSSIYTWTLPPGTIINSGQGTDLINVTAGTNAGYLKVVCVGPCGHDSDSVAITIQTTYPTIHLTATKDTVCVNWTTNLLMGTPSGGVYSGKGVAGPNFNATIAGIGNHYVYYTYSNGCISSDSVRVSVDACTGIDDINTLSDQVDIYPNPFSGSLNISVSEDEAMQVSIFNILGETVNTSKLKKGINLINTQSLPAGIYFVQVKSETGILSQKAVKIN